MSREDMKQEPMAWQCQCGKAYTVTCISSKPAKQWVGLTDEEIDDCEEEAGVPQYEISSADLYAFAQAIEAKLREKNT